MAFTPTKNLNAESEVILRDYTHAANTFNVDQFRLAPKHKFLFHVSFRINDAALRMIDINERYGNEVNLLVKSVDLPKYTVQTEVLNQYNRKKVVQYQHKLDPINLKFHDDNMGLISKLWWNYYTYYYGDAISADATGAYDRNATRSYDFIPSKYGLDNGSTVPFFKSIKIYQMARREYVVYELKNPTITSWLHGAMAYADSGLNEQTMSLAYEAVSYGSGNIKDEPIEGFGIEHYDNTPSPLTGMADSTTSIPTLNNQLPLETRTSILDTVITQINTYQNTQQPGVMPIQNTVTAISANQVNLNSNIQPSISNTAGSSIVQTLNGLSGIAFPFIR